MLFIQAAFLFIFTIVLAANGFAVQAGAAENPAFRIPKLDAMALTDALERAPGNDPLANELVSFSDVAFDDLPEAIKAQDARIRKECLQNRDAPEKPKYYLYKSAWHKENGRAGNYLVDTSPFKGTEIKPCVYGTLCQDGQCLLLAFTSSGKDTWQKDLSALHESFDFRHSEQSNRPPLLVIRAKGIACLGQPSQYPEKDGKEPAPPDQPCERTYVWESTGLHVTSP